MGCPTVKKAFEDSLRKDSLNNSDEFLVYDNGTIYNVTYGTFVLELGATGSISNGGDSSATPILVGTAPDYIIRGLRGGNGISAITNAFGSITINAQLGNLPGEGERVLDNATGATLNFRRIVAGSGISVSSTANAVVITNELTGATDNLVTVAQLSDFPEAIAGVITLSSNTVYELIDTVSTSNQFVMGNGTSLRGIGSLVSGIVYTGDKTMITTQQGSQNVSDLLLSCENGTLLDASLSSEGALIATNLALRTNNLGTLGHKQTTFSNIASAAHTGEGFTYAPVTEARLNMTNVSTLSRTGTNVTFIDLGLASFNALNIQNVVFLATEAGQTFLTGATGGANMAGDAVGYISRVSIEGGMEMLGDITLDDPGYNFQSNNKVRDTDSHALVIIDAPATTAITTINVPVKIDGAFTAFNAQLFAVSAAGSVTYIDKPLIRKTIQCSITATSSTGNNINYTFYVAINGAVVQESGIQRALDSANPGSSTLTWAHDFASGDLVEIWVENNSSTADCNVSNFILSID